MTEGLSLVINNPNEGEFLKEIVWNKEEVLEAVKTITEPYDGLVYTDEQIKDAKADRAKLNAMKKAISDRRIAIKKAYMVPIDKFESEVKEVVGNIEDKVRQIDSQVKEYEENQKSKKRQALEDYYNKVGKDFSGLVPFERIFDARWLNASTSEKKAKEEIDAQIRQIEIDLDTIESVCEEKYHTALKNTYFKTLNISGTMEDYKTLKDIDRRKEEERLRREAEEERQRQAESNDSHHDCNPKESVSKPEETVSEHPAQNECSPKNEIPEPTATVGGGMAYNGILDQVEKQYKASFTVYGTRNQIMDLKQYMIDNNIRFGKVEK